jgi:hypothetical protein
MVSFMFEYGVKTNTDGDFDRSFKQGLGIYIPRLLIGELNIAPDTDAGLFLIRES